MEEVFYSFETFCLESEEETIKKMHQQGHLLIFFLAFPLFSLCFGSFHEFPLPRPASLNTLRNQHFDLGFGSFNPRWNTDFYGSTTTTRHDRGSSVSGSPSVVNVDDFGAKGNGQDDDSKVDLIKPNIRLHSLHYAHDLRH